jgi:hypothetical protein
MKKAVFYRLCRDRDKGLVAIETDGYMQSFTTSDGHIIELGFNKLPGGTIRITELGSGVAASTVQTDKFTTYKNLIEYIETDPDYLDTTYRLMQEDVNNYMGLLDDLLDEGKVVDLETVKENRYNYL